MKHRPLPLIAAAAVTIGMVGVASAAHPFTDVEDGRWFSEPVDWAYENGITTGKTPTTFNGEDETNRFEVITFVHRYDQELVSPTLDDHDERLDTLEAVIATLGSRVEANEGEIDTTQESLETAVASMEADRVWAGVRNAPTVPWSNGDTLDLGRFAFVQSDGQLIIEYVVEVAPSWTAADAEVQTVTASVLLGTDILQATTTSITVNDPPTADQTRTLIVRAAVEVERGPVTITGRLTGSATPHSAVVSQRSLSVLFVPSGIPGLTIPAE